MFQSTPQKRVLFLRSFMPLVLGLLSVIFVLYTSIVPSPKAAAATDSTINFQARLLTASGSIVPDGTYNIEFKLYNTLTSSGSSQGSCSGDAACLWTETRTTTNKVAVRGGYLTVNLGSVTGFASTINWDQDLYLTMNIGGTGTASWDGEMNPRIHLTAIPYAFRAGSLASLSTGGFTSTLSFATGIGQNSTITLPDPGSSSATVCYQNAACGFVTGSGTAFLQGGNTFSGTTAGSLGTLNNGNLNFLTNNATRLTLDTSGNLQFQQASTVNIASATTGTQLTVKGGDATSGTNVGGNLVLQGGAGASTGASGSVIVKANINNATSAFVVQNAGGNQVLTVDTSGNQVLLGKPGASGVNGQLVFNNASNANTITLVSGATTGSYSLTLPTAGPGTSQCLQTDSVAASQLRFASCSAGGDLQSAYVASSTPATITTTSSAKTLLFKAGSGFDSTSLFQIQNAASAAVMTVDSTNSQVLLQGTNTTAILGPNLFTGSPICTGTGWTGSDPTWTHTNGGGTSDLDCTPPSSITFGETYQVSFNVTGLSGGDILTANIGGNPGSTVTENGSYVQVISANNSSLAMFFVNNSSSVAQITGIQIQLITPANNILAIQNSIGTNGIEIRSGGDGLFNTFVGFQSGRFATGDGNTALGNSALATDTSGTSNTAIGANALKFNTSGSWNIAIGAGSLFNNSIGNQNTAVGFNALNNNNVGSDNAAFGYFALIDNTTGSGNTALGGFNLESNTTGSDSTAVGNGALSSNLTGNQNVALGTNTLNSNTTGSDNVALGYLSLNDNNGDNNVSLGAFSLHGNSSTTFSDNIGIGASSLYNNTGDRNVGIGSRALQDQTSGSNNTALGYYAGYQDPNNTSFATLGNLTNVTVLGYGAQALSSNSLVLGAVGNTSGNLTPNVGIGTESPTNLLSVSPNVYDTGSICQGSSSCTANSTTITGGGTNFTAAMVGDEIVFNDGTKDTITAFIDATHVTVTTSRTHAFSAYRIHQPALQVTSTGNVGIGTVSPTANLQVTTQTNTTTAFVIQNASAVSLLTADTTNGRLVIGSGSAGETAGQILVLDSDSDATITNGGSNNTSAEVDGALFYSSTSHSFVCGESGAWISCLGGLRDSSTAAATAITAATDTNFSGGTGNTYTIPANDCVVGRVYRVQAYGVYSSATAARNITFKLKFGSTVLAASGGIQTVAGAANRGWSLTANITCITTGATGSVEAQGQVVVNNSTTGVTSNVGDMPNSAAIGSINTTAGQTLQLSAGWDATTNAPTITMRSFVVEGIGP